MPKSYFMVGGPCDETYRGFLRFSLEICDRALLVMRDPDGIGSEAKEVLGALNPFLLRASDEGQWPGTSLSTATARVFRYALNGESVKILESSVHGLFDWRLPTRPEDLSLLRGDTPWLTSVSHERIAFLDLVADERRALASAVPGLRLHEEDFVPPARELFRLFGAYLDDDSLESSSVAVMVDAYNADTRPDEAEQAAVSIRRTVSSLRDEVLLGLCIERWGGGRLLVGAGEALSPLLLSIAGTLAGRGTLPER
jgi:hypothetical protein